MKKFLSILLFLFTAFAYPLSPSEEKQILKDIAEIKATLKTFMEQTDRRFEELRQDLNKRFELMDKRITELREDMNKRFEQVDKRFEQLYTFLWIITGIFTTLTASVIAFAWWDRRTIKIRAFVKLNYLTVP